MSTSILDYVPLVTKVIAHWQQIETKTSKSLLLKDKSTIDSLIDLKDRLVEVQAANLTESNNTQRAQEVRDGAIQTLHPLVKQARASLKGLVEDVPGAKALPRLLSATTEPQNYLQAARDIAEIWATANTAQPEALTIPVLDGEATVQVSHTAFLAAVSAYESAVSALTTTKTTEARGRKTRDNLHKTAHAKLVAYPLAAKGRLADGDPLRATIPTLTNG